MKRPTTSAAPQRRRARSPHDDNDSDHHPTAEPGQSHQRQLPEPLFARHAGPIAVVAGVLVVAAQLMMLPFDPQDHIPTSQNVVFQTAGAVYTAGFIALAFALIGAHGWHARAAGRLGVIGVTVALIGTMMLGGDLWFESFAVPWLADGPAAQQVFDTDPTVVLGLGAIASYVSFAVGWALFGVASLRARVFPRSISIALVIGGLVGFSALLAPFGIPLGLAVGALGLWMTANRGDRHPKTRRPT